MDYTVNMKKALSEIFKEEEDIDSEKVIAFVNSPESFRSFGEGLAEIITKKYGNVDCKKHLMALAKDKGIYINRNTVNNWFEGNRPKKGEQSREHMFLIAFSLSLNVCETEDLFRKVYLDRPFNLRDRKEFVYHYCIDEGLSYDHAQLILSKIEQNSTPLQEETLLTCVIKDDLALLKNDLEVIDYINKHPHNFQIHTITAKKTLNELLGQVKINEQDKEKVRNGKVNNACSYTARELWRFSYVENGKHYSYLLDSNKDITSISSMLTIIEGGDLVATRQEQESSVFRNANLPQEIKNRFPTKHTFAAKNPTFEELRKMIILLYSYKMWYEKQYENEEIDLDTYINNMDEVLFDSGLQTLYYGNPYDWLFLYCTLSDSPLEIFREIMADAVWDNCQ